MVDVRGLSDEGGEAGVVVRRAARGHQKRVVCGRGDIDKGGLTERKWLDGLEAWRDGKTDSSVNDCRRRAPNAQAVESDRGDVNTPVVAVRRDHAAAGVVDCARVERRVGAAEGEDTVLCRGGRALDGGEGYAEDLSRDGRLCVERVEEGGNSGKTRDGAGRELNRTETNYTAAKT